MKNCLINKITVLIILFGAGLLSVADAQISTLLQGQVQQSNGSPYIGKVYLQWPEINAAVDSVSTDDKGNFRFERFAYGNYSIGINAPGVDNTVADIISVNILNPVKQNQHFKIEEGVLICTESNYTNIKDALENSENIFVLNLNSLQFDVADKSLSSGSDGSKKLSVKIGELINLESLTLDINGINALPGEIGNLKKLCLLSAQLNKLSTLPPGMEALKNLKVLNLGKNNFQQFPEMITGFTALEVLNFEGNPITVLPATIGSLKNLKELNLANCTELTALPSGIGQLSNLETLNLSKCEKLRSLPEEFLNLKNLKVLDVSGTKINVKEFMKAVPGCEIRN